MLIEFSVSNFRSFREKQTFSMVAVPRLGKKGNLFKPDVKGEKIPDLLKVAAIYGPNASGKSNLIKALGIVYEVIRHKPSTSSKPLPVSPFRFDSSLRDQPSRFEVLFISGGQRYEYVLAATSERIIEEKLIVFPKGKETLLFKRQYAKEKEEYVFGEELEGGEVLHETWRRLTSSKMLFISQAVLNSNDELKQLRIPYSWLSENLNTMSGDMEDLAQITLSIGNAHRELEMESGIASFLQEVDVPITNIHLRMKENSDIDDSGMTDADLNHIKDEKLRSVVKSYKQIKATLTHKTALGEAQFDFDEESDGTKNLIGFSLPWRLLGADASNIRVIAIDELDSSLHPKIVESLINKLINFKAPCQLIFTTHDTHLMDTKLLRRDQLWITERDMNGATQLRSVHDFEGRESEDVEKRYYEGRYRGLPFVRG